MSKHRWIGTVRRAPWDEWYKSDLYAEGATHVVVRPPPRVPVFDASACLVEASISLETVLLVRHDIRYAGLFMEVYSLPGDGRLEWDLFMLNMAMRLFEFLGEVRRG